MFAQVLASLQGISDRVEGSELGTAYVRLDGLERLYGGEARLVNALLNAVPQDLAPRVGVAETKFPAFVAARVSEPSRATRVPIDAVHRSLPLTPSTYSLYPPTLKSLCTGSVLHTMGDVASMTETSLVDRFGAEGRRAWHLSRGMDDSPVIPLAHVETVVERTSLPFSSASIGTSASPWLTPSLRGPSPVPRCVAGTRAKSSWSAPWMEARPGPEKFPLRGCWQPEASLIDNQGPA